MRRWFTLVLVSVAAVLAGCSAPTYHPEAAARPGSCLVRDADDGDLFVGLAVSGGGSRAALFGASGMKALAGLPAGRGARAVLEQVSYVSAVSGGSLASAYYVTHKPPRATAMLAAPGRLSDAYQEFFQAFNTAMARNYEGPMIRRQLLKFRGLNPAWTAVSLAEGLDETNFDGVTFAGLAAREGRGDSPHLLVNTTLYNDGRRLVFGAAAPEALHFDFPAVMAASAAGANMTPQARAVMEERWRILGSMDPAELQLDVCGVRLSSALVASMSYPPYIGPITMQVGQQGPYWHVGDGGLADNSGTESLFMVALRKLQANPRSRALIIALDSSFPFAVGGRALDERREAFTRDDDDFSRIPGIMEERANAYRAYFLMLGQDLGVLPPPERLAFVVMRHTDAAWQPDLSDVPAACRKEHADWQTPDDVRRHLAQIPTRLYLKSACDRDLIGVAASRVVAQNAERIRQFLQ